jgi:hypothetical protein
VTYAIAVGAVERGQHYLKMFPGWGGWMLAVACTGVVFLAGAKLLDSVKAPAPAVAMGPYLAPTQRRHPLSRSRPMLRSTRRGAASPTSRRRD